MEENEEQEEYEPQYVFGIEVPDMSPGIQPLEVIVLIKGINMEDGSPTLTTIGSQGLTPWEAIGMMYTEIERQKFMTVYASFQQPEEGEYEEE